MPTPNYIESRQCSLPSCNNFLTFVSGCLLGSILTQLIFLSAHWQARQKNSVTEADQLTQLEHIESSVIFANSADVHLMRVNGTYNATSSFRGPPTPEVDAAWEGYWKIWMLGIDGETFRASHPQYPEASVRLQDSGKYLATFGATHQLHCLYNLFRASYLDVYQNEKADYDKDPRNWHERVDHCVEILRQKLECDRDTNIITYNWVRGKKVPMANFNVQRTCPDWGVMDRWAAQHQVPELPTKPPNAVQLPYIP